MTRPSHCPRRAFTLIEILTAVAILSLIVVVLMQIIALAGANWRLGIANAERRQNGRAIADFIGQELRSAMLPVAPNANPSQPNLQFILNSGMISATYSNPSTLFWQSPIAPTDAAGDAAEIGYFVRWVTSSSVPQAQLCRFYVAPGDPNYLIYTNKTWLSNGLLDAVAPANVASDYVGLFADNVVGFWVRCFQADGSLITGAKGTYDSRITNNLPASIEISLLMLDRHSAARLTTAQMTTLISLTSAADNANACLSTVQNTSDLRSIVQGARAYSTRIFLENSQPRYDPSTLRAIGWLRKVSRW